MVHVREVERVRTLRGVIRVVEVKDEDELLVGETVEIVDPLFDGKRTRHVTDDRGRFAYEQRDEELAELRAPREYDVVARGVRIRMP